MGNRLAIPKVSEDDIKLARRLAQAGEIVSIDVLDQIVIGDKSCVSLRGRGLF